MAPSPPPSFRHAHAHTPGDFTPEISPLDEFINRGRLLSKQLGTSPTLTPLTVHASLRRTGRSPSPLTRSRTVNRDSPPASITPPLEDRPTSSYPRFSTVSETDSVCSDAASVRDSSFTLISGFLNADRNMPSLQAAGRKVEYEQTGRVSMEPVIVGNEDKDKDMEVSPKSGRGQPGGYAPYTQQGGYGPNQNRGRDRRRSPDQDGGERAAAYARSRSQPPARGRMPPGGHHPQHPVRQDSNGAAYPVRHDSERQLPLRQDSAPRYRPYRQDSSSSGATSIGPLSRQGSSESEVFPPPQRQGSGNSLIFPLSRQGSSESEKFPAPLHRQGSGNSDRLHPHRQDSRGSDPRMMPRRQGSGESGMKYMPYRAGPPPPLGLTEDRRPSLGEYQERRRPSRQDSYEPQFHPGPQRSPTHSPAMFMQIAGMRAMSPEVDHDGAFGPPTPSYHDVPRPGSAASVSPSLYSIGGTPKPVFNFSRPLSNKPSIDTMRPTLDIPLRLTPEQSPMFPDEYSIPTPVSMSEECAETDGPAPTVVYSRFALPRGRILDRNSVLFLEPQLLQPTQSHQQPSVPSSPRPPSPSSPPQPFLHPAPRDRAATYNSRSPTASPRPQLLSPSQRPNTAGAAPRSPRSLPPVSPSAMSPDDHVQKGIDLHESGSLQESTYHLRLAANGGHPTGMLLFALACRHGWGMKANPKEGVQWLKRVTELASSEVADDELKGAKVDLFEKKGRRAQFALSIYELGVSHMNGWGTEMDKGLAVRCFEIAGKWGDPDALAETGFCYANGVGCKKDLKKSAKFYRMAEAKGMNMVGNSWIWKDKYLDDEDRAAKNSKGEGEKASKKKK